MLFRSPEDRGPVVDELPKTDPVFGQPFYKRPMVISPVSVGGKPPRLLLGGRHLYESEDLGTTIHDLSASLFSSGSGPGSVVTAIALGGSASLDKVLYAFFGSQPFVRDSAGAVHSGYGKISGNPEVKSVAIDEGDWQVAFAATDSELYMTVSGGASWKKVTGELGKLGGTIHSVQIGRAHV